MIRAILAAAALVAAGCGAASSTVLVVRHAEKGPGRDPDLTGEGRRRSVALVEHAREAGVVAAFHTPFKRTAQTVAPIAEHLGIPLIQVEYTPGQEAAHADAILRIIEEKYAGKPVVIAGHTTTIPVILQKLGVATPREVPETEYGTLFVVSGGEVSEVRFGP